jgi:two-component system response regulator LytT
MHCTQPDIYMPYKVVILEDNPITAADLREILEKENFDVIKTFSRAEVAIREIENYDPDILLVDVYLAGDKTGIDFVNHVNHSTKLPVVYITANSEKRTISEVVNSNPSAFLSKPYKENDVLVAVDLALRKNQENSDSASLQFEGPLFLKSGNSFHKVRIEDIDYLEASGSYCQVFSQGRTFVLSNNLSTYQDSFIDQGFIRIHRSYMVNLSKVDQINGEQLWIGKKALAIGRSYRSSIKTYFNRLT